MEMAYRANAGGKLTDRWMVWRFLSAMGLLLCVLVSRGEAAEKWLVLGNTVWVSGDSRLTLEMPSVSHPDLKITSTAAADLQWIETVVPWQSGDVITAVGLCYRTVNSATAFISQIRLAEYLLPSPATVEHDDGTDLTSTAGECYLSPVANYSPGGSVNLSLRLNFLSTSGEIRLGALGIRVNRP